MALLLVIPAQAYSPTITLRLHICQPPLFRLHIPQLQYLRTLVYVCEVFCGDLRLFDALLLNGRFPGWSGCGVTTQGIGSAFRFDV